MRGVALNLKIFNWTKEYKHALLSEQIKIGSNKFQTSSDRSCNEKQRTCPLSVPPARVSEHERTDTFATFHIAEDEEVIVSDYTPQKIDYQSFPKKPASNEPYKRFEKMRVVKAERDAGFSVNGISVSVFGMGDASQFVAQAKYMETFDDNYKGHADFQCYYSTYMNMNDEQLRTYFTWRTMDEDYCLIVAGAGAGRWRQRLSTLSRRRVLPPLISWSFHIRIQL